MNINEIRETMNASRSKNAKKAIEKIEDIIKIRALGGYNNCRLSFPADDLENTNFDEVFSYFREQGFSKIKGTKFQQIYTIKINWEDDE